jgi:hypothetical protein
MMGYNDLLVIQASTGRLRRSFIACRLTLAAILTGVLHVADFALQTNS